MLILTACGGKTTTKPSASTPSGTDEPNKEMKEYRTVYDTEVTHLDYLVSS